jgi:hypothetical protein
MIWKAREYIRNSYYRYIGKTCTFKQTLHISINVPWFGSKATHCHFADFIVPSAATHSPSSSLPEFDSAQAATGSEIEFLSQFNLDFNMLTDSSFPDRANVDGPFPAETPLRLGHLSTPSPCSLRPRPNHPRPLLPVSNTCQTPAQVLRNHDAFERKLTKRIS